MPRLPIGALAITLLLLGGGAVARQPHESHSWAADGAYRGWLEVEAGRIRVLLDDPAALDFAQQVAGRASAALDIVAELFATEPPEVTVTLDAATDLLTAVAPPLPRPRVAMPALFPVVPQADLRSADPLFELLLHELTHSVQLAYLETPGGAGGLPRLGLVGEAVTPVPPGWLLEGLAVWVAATFTPGASVLDARSRGVLESLALEGEWPELADVALLTWSEWPAGEARYLLGGAFVDYLVQRYGWEALLGALREANAAGHLTPFSVAWRRATGDRLEDAWADWAREVRTRAADRLRRLPPAPPPADWTIGGSGSTVLALHPADGRLAWRPPGGGLIVVAAGDDAPGEEVRVLPPHLMPVALTWSGPETLAYVRLAPATEGRFFDLFELDLGSGVESRLTRGARARFVAAEPSGCLLYVRDVAADGSQLRRHCRGGEPQLLYRADPGTHIVGLATSRGGRIALSVWRDGFADLALLVGGELRWLTRDPAQDLDPAWQGEEELVFRSDRNGTFELYALTPGEGEARRLTASIGGAFAPAAGAGQLAYARLGGQGVDMVWGPQPPPLEVASLPAGTPVAALEFPSDNPVRPYHPFTSLAPYGWLPEVRSAPGESLPGVALTVFGRDDSGDHAYQAAAGYAPGATGPAGGAWARLRYDFRPVDILDLFQRPPTVGFGVSFGSWPYLPHLGNENVIGVGLTADLRLRVPLGTWSGAARLEGGLVHLPGENGPSARARIDAVASRRRSDSWGYGTLGPRLSLHALWEGGEVADSAAAWIDASVAIPAGAGAGVVGNLATRAGYRQRPPVPLRLAPWSLTFSAGARESLPVRWRLADGVLALERLTLEGNARAWYDGNPGFGGDLSVWADLVVRYGAPVSFGISGGRAQDWWYRFGVRLPL